MAQKWLLGSHKITKKIVGTTARSKRWLNFGCRNSDSECAAVRCSSVGTIGSSLVGKIVSIVRSA